MHLNSEQVTWAKWAVWDVLSRVRLDGRMGWDAIRRLESLHQALTSASVGGSETDPPAEQLSANDLIDTEEAATILGCSTRWVRQIRADIDGSKVGGRWLFPRRTVVDYADLKDSTRDGNRVPGARSGTVPPRAA
jgi:hypothetical protein